MGRPNLPDLSAGPPSAGALWVGTPFGAARVTGAGWEPIRRPWAPLPSAEVTDLATGPNGEVWIATTGGLLRRDADGTFVRAIVENAPLPYPTVLGVAVDRRGVAWAATVAGAAGVDPARDGRAFNSRTAPLMHNLLDAAFVDRAGRVWFGGVGGVNVYEPAADWSMPGRWPAGFNRLSTNGGLPDNLVFSIFEDSRGRVWLGTEDGAAALAVDPLAYALGSSEPDHWLSFGVRNSGLVHDKVHAFAEDRRGRIYFATEKGVSIYDESQPEPRRWSAIDGTRLPAPYAEALLAAPDGRVWIGTKGGLTVFDPDRPGDPLPVYRANPLRRWTGLFWGPHARLDAPGDQVNALAWAPPPR
jgi:ligand-binding sensor domain-containing protein